MKLSNILEKVLKIGAVVGVIGGTIIISKKSVDKEKELHNRFRQYYELTNQWLLNKNEGKEIRSYFEENEYRTIAIYGMGTVGELFYKELKEANIKVAYFIDKNAEELYYGLDTLPVIGLDQIKDQDKVDAIIVTPFYDFEEISDNLRKKIIQIEIISLEDVIYGI